MAKTINCPKCEHEHEPSGSHEDDSGKTQCQACGFSFNVEIEYSPEYHTFCEQHDFLHCVDEKGVPYKLCRHCQRTWLKG